MHDYDEARSRAEIEANRAAFQRKSESDSRAAIGIAMLFSTLGFIAMLGAAGVFGS